ncbi:receptor-like cytosolic serine/threonine-protein kinase RBK1 isoform X2 [Rhodamnia argentea]|uniref:Receptor-like cytosolic serine/threonine-protein kinase RBK1 isoform X2 n=1 Tax=Rhodamnia argentea TaxID=178133 RepID=A0ABM3H9U2_9MYRT|nr:receptor-like cytosolic serine/threonine-protein kinase RBK1 isoform X2 [Rhodamnia argentea]
MAAQLVSSFDPSSLIITALVSPEQNSTAEALAVEADSRMPGHGEEGARGIPEKGPEPGGVGKEEANEGRASSPRGVLEIPSLSSDSDHSGCGCSSSSATAEKPTAAQRLHWWSVVDALKRRSARKLLPTPSPGIARADEDAARGRGWKTTTAATTKKKKKLLRIHSAEDGMDRGALNLPAWKPTWRSFDLAELVAATDNFCPENLIGKGGHAEVYKGRLPDGQLVAVKRLMKKDKEEEIRTADFLSELGIIAHIDHPNAARLLGYGVDGGLHLVLRFSPHGSLASVLHGSTESLEWKVRFKVAVGVAEGLKYLHYSCQRRIIHRDIKASNILLTEDYEPQISDFGLAKWLPEKWAQHVVFPIEGTFGYLAPEYFMHGIVDEKIDVFAFGVLLLELITGRHAVDSTRQSLVMWAKPLLDVNNIRELADPRLKDTYDIDEMQRATLTASMCVHWMSTMRPDMKKVVQMLQGEDGSQEWKQKSVSGRALLLDACDLEDYSCTTYLEDLNRHMQLLLE